MHFVCIWTFVCASLHYLWYLWYFMALLWGYQYAINYGYFVAAVGDFRPRPLRPSTTIRRGIICRGKIYRAENSPPGKLAAGKFAAGLEFFF